MSVLAILGSSRSDGNTSYLLNVVIGNRDVTLIDLAELSIDHYSYDLAGDRDDFRQVMKALDDHRVILFATPVYWYAMSGRMKVLFDRFTDLLTSEKPLTGRRIFLVATGTKPELPSGFEVPFRDTAEYLGMSYHGALYVCMRDDLTMTDDDRERARHFGDQVFGE